MGIKTNASIITDGLAFNVDLASTRSYAGPPIRNIATQISQSYANNTSALFKITNGTETVNIPSLGTLTSKYVDVYNDYAGGSTECCVSLFNYGTDLATNGSTLHTYAIVYKSVNDYTHPNYMYRYEYNGPTYVLEGGLFNTSNRIHLGDDWYWAWGTFTTNAATTRFNSVSLFMYEYLKFNRIYLAKVLLCQGDYSTLHPRYWPEVNTTRSNTQAILDLTKNNTVTATGLTYGLTYASNGNISYNGSSNYLTVTNSTPLQVGSIFSINAWVRPTSLAARGGIFSTRTANEAGSWQLEVGPANGTNRIAVTGVGTWIWESGDNAITNNTWVNICYVRGGVPSEAGTLYLNGNVVTPVTTTSYTILNNSSNKAIGSGTNLGQFFTGNIDSVSLYNRMLTTAEVTQNFNAHRGRYGI